MSVYRVTAKQVYYIEADNPDEAIIHFIEEDGHVGTGFTDVTEVKLVEENTT